MSDKKYLKKIIVNNEYASADARGDRLRKVRNLANLTRKDLCNSFELKLNTYKGWELGRFGGLPADGAERVLKRIAQENVICSIDWLLYGEGQEPYLVPGSRGAIVDTETDFLLKEITIFQNLYQNAIYLKINDDTLSPVYVSGDYVAGIRVFDADISTALNQVCIIQLANGELLCRYLREGLSKNKYKVLATNLQSKASHLQLLDAEINFAAPVVRHYKPISSHGLSVPEQLEAPSP